jgi:iron complex outermembrane receptor protein
MPLLTRQTTVLGLAITAVLAASEAPAQATTPGELPEVVVTARQREERIQDVPATVQAFTSVDIQSAGIQRPADFIALTPNVSQVQTAEAGDMQVAIRGINTGRDAETNFALVVDGVLQTNPNALNQELANITQIEVLKGPQGALYGRNALAGAFILTTRKPGDALEMDLEAGYGSDSTYRGRFYVGGPLGGSAGGSLSAYTRSTDGQFKNSLLGCDDCVDYFEESGAIGRLVFDAGDSGEIDVKAKVSTIESGAINFNASLALAEAAAFLGVPQFQENANDHPFVYLNNVKPVNEQDNLNLSIKGEWDVGGGNTLTAIAAYNDQENFFLTDGTSAAFFLYSLTASCQQSNEARAADTPLPVPFFYVVPSGGFVQSFLTPYSPTTCDGYQYQQRDQEDMSFEIRIASPGDARLRWLAGLYYADIDRHVIVSQGSDSGAGFVRAGFVPTSGPNPTDLLYDDDFTSEVLAGFGQLAYDVTDSLEVALAARYDTEDREVDNNVPRVAPQTPGFFGTNTFINPAYVVDPGLTEIPSRSRDFSQFQPKLSINWQANENWSLYTSYGYGFRSGGFNSQGSSATVEAFYSGLCLGPTLAAPPFFPVCTGDNRSLTGVNDDYDKEVSKAFEAGFKSQLLDNRLSFNGAIYHTDVDDMQYFNFFAGPFGLLRVVTNLDEVSIQGFELDFRWLATENFSIFGGYGYTDGEIDRYDGRPYTAGNEIPYVPEYSGNLGFEFRLPVGSGGMEFVTRVDGVFVGDTWFHPVQDELVPNLFTGFGFGQGEFSRQKRDAYATVNARIGFEGERWAVTAWGRNVGDEDYLQEVIPAPEFGGSFIHDSAGDSYGLDVRYSFR